MTSARASLAISLLLVACKTREQPPAQAESLAPPLVGLAADLDALRANLGVPALAAAAWHHGKLVELAAVGLRSRDDPKIPVTTADRWYLGSNTVPMTAMLIGVFVDRGVVHWDDRLATLFRGHPVDAGYAGVTLDQLLEHVGGLPMDPPDDLWDRLVADGDAPDARSRFVRGLLARAPERVPGTYAPSPAGHIVAAAALESATGKRWEQLMRDEVFAKLGMTRCGFGVPGSRAVDQPRGHDVQGRPVPAPPAEEPRGPRPADAVHCALEDYGKFLNVLATGAPALVTPETLRHLRETGETGPGRGWSVLANPHPVLSHSATATTWYSFAFIAPDQELAYAVVSNQEDDRVQEAIGPLGKYVAGSASPAPQREAPLDRR